MTAAVYGQDLETSVQTHCPSRQVCSVPTTYQGPRSEEAGTGLLPAGLIPVLARTLVMLNKESWRGQGAGTEDKQGNKCRHGVGQAWLKAMSASHCVNLSFELC